MFGLATGTEPGTTKKAWCQAILLAPRLEAFALPGIIEQAKVEGPRYICYQTSRCPGQREDVENISCATTVALFRRYL